MMRAADAIPAALAAELDRLGVMPRPVPKPAPAPRPAPTTMAGIAGARNALSHARAGLSRAAHKRMFLKHLCSY